MAFSTNFRCWRNVAMAALISEASNTIQDETTFEKDLSGSVKVLAGTLDKVSSASSNSNKSAVSVQKF